MDREACDEQWFSSKSVDSERIDEHNDQLQRSLDAVNSQSLVSGVPAQRLVDQCCVYSECGNAAKLLQSHGVEAVCETFAHACGGKETHVADLETFAVFMRGDELVEFDTNTLILNSSRPEFGEVFEAKFWLLWILLEEPSGRLDIEKGNCDEGQTNGYLNDVRHTPCNIVWRAVERHPITSPESDECPKLVAKLGDRADETSSKRARGTLGDIQIGSDIDTSKAETAESTLVGHFCHIC